MYPFYIIEPCVCLTPPPLQQLQTDNYQSRTMKLIEDLKVAINDPKIKNPASDKGRK